jgi:hypothetical protein
MKQTHFFYAKTFQYLTKEELKHQEKLDEILLLLKELSK